MLVIRSGRGRKIPGKASGLRAGPRKRVRGRRRLSLMPRLLHTADKFGRRLARPSGERVVGPRRGSVVAETLHLVMGGRRVGVAHCVPEVQLLHGRIRQFFLKGIGREGAPPLHGRTSEVVKKVSCQHKPSRVIPGRHKGGSSNYSSQHHPLYLTQPTPLS